ncbi:spermatogenic leucine zipper protein 1 [Peromyscus eremicus]|uniref:spermatogenic leucine zipper protein 1 n=1 Tax=Peromyscus eremicus TaxID=42410 RepID=UPI0027DC71DA|nr:spermatogenic leucine zipper protein 1 [Peromyscus eremicus]
MSDSDSVAEMPGQPQTPNPTPCVNQEPPNPGITISLLEIGSLPPFCWSSLPSPKNSIRPLTRPRTVQKFSNLLRDVRDVLKSIAGFEEQTTEVRESFDDASTSKDMSELKIRGVDKRNKMRFKDLIFNFDAEKEQNTKKQETIWNDQRAKNMMHGYARDLCHSEGKRGSDDMQLSMERGRYGPLLHHCGKYGRVRGNMEQLLQETDHWSTQRDELSDVTKSYQGCQKERRESCESNHVSFQTQSDEEEPSSKQELEAQVKKLSHDTHSLHLIAALLQNECQILQQRVDILREFHLHESGSPHERPLLLYHVYDRKSQKSAEADRMEGNRQPARVIEGGIPRREKILRGCDVCLSKKARNNRFNTRVARKTLLVKRRPISSSFR